jgi:hypothetical protein
VSTTQRTSTGFVCAFLLFLRPVRTFLYVLKAALQAARSVPADRSRLAAALPARTGSACTLCAEAASTRGATDGDLIDETEMFIAVVREFEPPHARCLAAAVQAMKVANGPWVTAERVQSEDRGVGVAAALLLRNLCDKTLLRDLDRTAISEIMDRRERGATYQAPITLDVFQVTDLGYAVAEWFSAVDRELGSPIPGPNEDSETHASGV